MTSIPSFTFTDLSTDPKLQKSKRIGVLTSGGDSAGMNAAVRAVVRMGLVRGCEVYVIREGWEGLVRGNDPDSDSASPPSVVPKLPLTTSEKEKKFEAAVGEGEYLKEGESEKHLKGKYIVKVGWHDVRGFLREGGTLIGTARCMPFREVEGRRKAALNLIIHGIDALVVCGGDGSLTGADRLRDEWPEHLKALKEAGKITDEQFSTYQHLNIVGLVGSIDNDMATTDLTIGASTALHRICEAVDSISSTAASHSRAFVVEVMGRHCGWLAIMAGIATGADYVFLPEKPHDVENWEDDMCEVLKRHRAAGKRKSIVIVAEGAHDRDLKPIKPDEIQKILTNRLKLDTRVTTLGHTQRGGAPCAYDRILATLQGVEAVEALLSSTPETPSPIIGVEENKIIRQPLMEAVQLTQAVATAIGKKDFDKALSLRDPEFEDCLGAFDAITRLDGSYTLPEKERLRVAIIHIGAPAGGMNAATRTAVRYCLARGHTPLGIYNSWPGLLDDNIAEIGWLRVDNWTTRGGSELGTNRTMPDVNLAGVAQKIKEHRIDAILAVGGFEAFRSLMILNNAAKDYPELGIPMVQLPATISNNVPVTEWSLGSDTSINVLMDACDVIKQSATASRNRVFTVECQGGECGFIAIMGALASGAVVVYTPEVGIDLSTLSSDIEYLKNLYRADKKGKSEGRLVIRSEKSSTCYTTEVLTNILKEEGRPLFDSRLVSLGHTLQGGVPTPRDRLRAVRLAMKCIGFLEQASYGSPSSRRGAARLHLTPEEAKLKKAVIAIQGSRVRFVGMEEMEMESDLKNRRGKRNWWTGLKSLVEILGGRRDLSSAPLNILTSSSSFREIFKK